MRMTFAAKGRFSDFQTGWLPEHHPSFDPGDGWAFAHDVLEHRLTDPDRIENELMAIGAGVYVKEFCTNVNWVPGAGEDSYSFSKRHKIPEPQDTDEEIPASAQARFGRMMDWFIYARRNGSYPDTRVLGWWQHGYLAARRRYAGIDRGDLLNAHRWLDHNGDALRFSAEIGDRLLVEVNKVQVGSYRSLHIVLTHVGGDGSLKHKTEYGG